MRRFVAVVLTLAWSVAPALAAGVTLPPPAGAFPDNSFFTAVAFLPDCRLVAFDGLTVHLQDGLGGDGFTPLGSLPSGFLGGTDPAFVAVSPSGARLLLGAGFGGSRGFLEPALNGNLFLMPADGGPAVLAGSVPFHVQPAFLTEEEVLLTVGSPFFTSGTVALFDLGDASVRTVVAGIPGAPGGLALDAAGDLFVGIGFGADPFRTGEIRRFPAADLDAAVATGTPLDFDADGTRVGQALNAGHLAFDGEGNLLAGGGDLFGLTGAFGFYALLDPDAGTVLATFDPTDGDPGNGSFVFFTLAHCPALGVTLAVDLNSFFFAPAATGFYTATGAPASPFSVEVEPEVLFLGGSGDDDDDGGGVTVTVANADPALVAAAAGAALTARPEAGAGLPLTLEEAEDEELELTLSRADLERGLAPSLPGPAPVTITVEAGVLPLGDETVLAIGPGGVLPADDDGGDDDD